MPSYIKCSEYDEATGTSSIILEINGEVYYGTAQAHPDDMDLANSKTGLEIALHRAEIDALSARIKQLKIELGALNQLYYSINQSKRFNAKSYENIMLQRQIRMKQEDIQTVKEVRKQLKADLSDYITRKDIFYKQVRRGREANPQ